MEEITEEMSERNSDQVKEEHDSLLRELKQRRREGESTRELRPLLARVRILKREWIRLRKRERVEGPPPLSRRRRKPLILPPAFQEEDKGDILMSRFYEHKKPGSSTVMEGYERFITEGLRKRMSAEVEIGPFDRFSFVDPVPDNKPTIILPDKREVPFTPKVARDKNTSYVTNLLATVIHKRYNQETKIFEEIDSKIVDLGSIPIMVGSCICHTHGKTDEELIEMGEDPRDPMGFFITKGAEKVILMEEKLRYNKIFVYYEKSAGKVITSITCSHPTGTDKNVIFSDEDILKFHISFMGADKGGSKKYNNIPISKLFALMGTIDEIFSNEQYIVEHVLQFVPPRFHNSLEVKLKLNLSNLSTVSRGIDDIPILKEYDPPKTGNYEIKVLSMLFRTLFSHMNESQQKYFGNTLNNKFSQLCYMISIHLLSEEGYRKFDDRDNWSNKKVDTAGTLLESLFNSSWREMIKSVKRQFGDPPKGDITLDSFINKLKPHRHITENLVNSITSGKWGAQKSHQKEDVTEPHKRESTTAPYSHITKINTPTSTRGSSKARMIHQSSVGFIDVVKTPEGQRCGLIKNLAITAHVSLERSPEIFYSQLREFDVSRVKTEDTSNAIFINGGFYGWARVDDIRRRLLEIRRSMGILSSSEESSSCIRRKLLEIRRDTVSLMDTSIALDGEGNLQIYTDGGRLTRPLLILDDNEELVIDKLKLWGSPFGALLENGAIEYVDAAEQETYLIHMFIDDVKRKKNIPGIQGRILELEQQKMEIEEGGTKSLPRTNKTLTDIRREIIRLKRVLIRISTEHRYTHSEMDPTAIFGYSAALIPGANRNQGARKAYRAAQSDQEIGTGHANLVSRFDSDQKRMLYPQPPVLTTLMEKYLDLDLAPSGQTVKVAIMTYGGWTNEDALIFNQGSVDRGLFRVMTYRSYKALIESRGNVIEKLEKPNAPDRKRELGIYQRKYENIQDNGLPIIGSYLKAGDVIISKTITIDGVTEPDPIRVKIGEEGVVDSILVETNAGKTIVKVKIRKMNVPQIGDKFADRHAQKGTIGMILPQADMPVSVTDGSTPDLIINPHSIPSRMTISKMVEILTSKYGALVGERINGTTFRENLSVENMGKFKEALRALGYQSEGEERFLVGTTGSLIEGSIFTGPVYYQALKHMVKDKIQVRGIKGPRDPKTGQPVRGRNRGGGAKIGYMERAAFLSHGAFGVADERMCYSSDRRESFFCTKCGSFSQFEGGDHGCAKCGRLTKEEVVVCDYPGTFKYVPQLMAALNVKVSWIFRE